jgi:hypothetical protein
MSGLTFASVSDLKSNVTSASEMVGILSGVLSLLFLATTLPVDVE